MHPLDRGRKLDNKEECPVDNFLYIFVEKLAPILNNLKITPNQVTFFSYICALISLYLLCSGSYKLSALFWAMNYLFDHTDGYMARKYNMITKIGDKFDHITDSLSHVILFYIFYKTKRYKELFVISIVYVIMTHHLTCQEIIYDNMHESDALNIINNLDLDINEKNIKYSRYFGPGMVNLLIVYFIYTSHNNFISK